MENIPKERWSVSHHLLIYHGRNVCKSQRPNCAGCHISQWCRYRMEQT